MDLLRFLFINNTIDLSNKIGMILQLESAICIPFLWPMLTANCGIEDDEAARMKTNVNYLITKEYPCNTGFKIVICHNS